MLRLLCVFVLAVSTASAWADGVQTVYVRAISGASGDITDEQRETLRRMLEESIVATGRFNVNTRDDAEVDAILDDALIAGETGALDTPIDWIISPAINVFSTSVRSAPIPGLQGRYTRSAIIDASISVRVLDTSTGRIETQFVVDVDRTLDLGVSTNSNSGYFSANDSLLRQIAEDMAEQLNTELFENLVPAVVAAVISDQVWINRGSNGGYAPGMVLRVFSADAPMVVDPITGRELGRADIRVGTVEINEVRNDVSIANIIDGAGEIEVGGIVRQ